MPDTGPQLIWRAFGAPAPEGKTGAKYGFEPCGGVCATCAAEIEAGVPFSPRRGVAGVDNDTFHGHAEYARFGSHVCAACAWLYGDPKRTHRAVIAVGSRGAWPTISAEIDGRPRWRHALGWIAEADPATLMTGVLTTDPKPRLWPRIRLASCGAPGLYLHVPEQDVSGWVGFDLRRLAQALIAVDAAIAAGATKTLALRGLWRSPKLTDTLGLDRVAALESALAPFRGAAELKIAAVVA